MKSLLLNPSKTEKKQSGGLFTPVRKGIVQQKCACGGTPGLTGECAECRRKGLFDRERSFLRPKLIISQPNERSEEEADSTAERASMESRVGHDFSRVRVNRIGSDVIQPKRAIRPPSSDLPTLRRQASIYRHGQTPVVDERGNLRAWGVTPASAEVTARHLGEVRGRFGEEGLARSVRGLAITRGADFADEAMRRAAVPVRKEATVVQASAANREASAGISSSVDASPPSAISGARPGKPLPADLRARLAALSGHSLGDVRIHDDGASHRAARMLNARAFTLGSSIYFGENEYRPASPDGKHLLAHEVAHTVQQQGAFLRSSDLEVSAPGSAEEQEAERFADAAVGKEIAAPRLSAGCAGGARVMQVISFTRSNDRITTSQAGVTERAADFDIATQGGTDPHFLWLASISTVPGMTNSHRRQPARTGSALAPGARVVRNFDDCKLRVYHHYLFPSLRGWLSPDLPAAAILRDLRRGRPRRVGVAQGDPTRS